MIELGAEDRGGSLTMAHANIAYTSYLQALALRGGPLDIMAALLPCSWSYVEIATALRERVDTTHPIYGGWIAYFSKPEVVQMVAEMRHDFDELMIHEATSDQRWRDIAHVFATSSRLERGFWQMAYTVEQWPDLSEG